MAKNKNYLNNDDLKEEMLKCINDGYDKALKAGFTPDDPIFCNTELFPLKRDKSLDEDMEDDMENDDMKVIKKKKESLDIVDIFIQSHPDYDKVIGLGFVPERSIWIKKVRSYSHKAAKKMISEGRITQAEISGIEKKLAKPVASERLGRMFQLIVNNASRSFYWANPDDGQDCKANALFDMCSNFWKFEPIDEHGKVYNAFAYCSQMAYFGLGGAWRQLHPKKYKDTISISCLDENGKSYDFYNI